jgi:hypothetical protein
VTGRDRVDTRVAVRLDGTYPPLAIPDAILFAKRTRIRGRSAKEHPRQGDKNDDLVH